MKVHVKAEDTVIVISGEDKGKKGKVLQVSPKEGKVIVEGVNLVKKHIKPRPPQEAGGIVDAEAPMYASKVQLFCSKCGKEAKLRFQPTEGRPVYCSECFAEMKNNRQ